ncbi:MAG: AMP-binding protein [Mycobacteriales bacterium]
MFDLLAAQAAATPDHEAVVTVSGRLTYAGLLARARQVAAALEADGVGPGDRVALLADNRLEWLEVAFGAAALGARLVPLNTWVKAQELAYLLDHARPSVLVIVDRLGRQDFVGALLGLVPEAATAGPGQWRSERLPGLRSLVTIGASRPPSGAVAYDEWRGPDRSRPGPGRAGPDDIAMVLYTSGSTAAPKAVALAHRDLLDNGFEIGERQGLGPSDRVFLASPLFWAFGGGNALPAAFMHGSTLVLQSQFEPAGALELMETERCTAFYLMPVMAHALLGAASFDPQRLATVRRGITLGTPSEFRLVTDRLGIDLVCNIYGLTEVYGNCCVTPADAPLDRRSTSQGPPLAGVELRIADPDTGAVLPTGATGEICIRGRVTPGYVDADGHPVPASDDEGFFHSGDLGFLDESGWLTFVGRSTEMIKTAGINVSPAEVEEFLRSHPEVAEVAVSAGAHGVRGQQVVAFVRFAAGATTTPQSLRTWCKERIASYKVPAVVVAVDELPTTSTGKLARRELASLADEAVAAGEREGAGLGR